MIWMYYSAIIVLFGVEVTRAYRLGREVAEKQKAIGSRKDQKAAGGRRAG
jgi:uncharacterized BrkB/YihY/UPF0761 family membrane protein